MSFQAKFSREIYNYGNWLSSTESLKKCVLKAEESEV